jgi:hypothetical protein
MHSRRLLVAGASACFLWFGACRNDVDDDVKTFCAPGKSIACVTETGCTSVEVCTDDGSHYGLCVCMDAGEDSGFGGSFDDASDAGEPDSIADAPDGDGGRDASERS